jgi:hypothetical protein
MGREAETEFVSVLPQPWSWQSKVFRAHRQMKSQQELTLQLEHNLEADFSPGDLRLFSLGLHLIG